MSNLRATGCSCFLFWWKLKHAPLDVQNVQLLISLRFGWFILTAYCLCEQSRCNAVNQPIRAELIISCWAVVILVWLCCWLWVLGTVRGLATVVSPQPIAQELKHHFLCITQLKISKKSVHIYCKVGPVVKDIFITVLGWLSSTLLHVASILSSSSSLQFSIYYYIYYRCHQLWIKTLLFHTGERASQVIFGHCYTNALVPFAKLVECTNALVPLADKNRNVCMSHGNSNGMLS